MRKYWGKGRNRVELQHREFRRVPTEEERQEALRKKLNKNSWDLDKEEIRAVYVAKAVQPEPPVSPTPAPTPTPSPIVYYVSIQPSSATQYENVILSASTNLSSPTFVWTLTDFYDTTDTQVSSYTGATLTEGYFTSTGSSNVSVVATGTEGSATGSTFSVSEFSPSDISDLFGWIDFSDDSTITYRTGTNYIESIEDKSGNWTLSQTTASYQPLMLTGGSTDTSSLLQVASFDGIDNYLLSDGLASPVTTFTAHTSFTMGTQKVKGNGEPNGRSMYWEIGRMISANGSTSFADRRNLCRRDDVSQIFGIGYAFSEDSKTTYDATFTDYPQAYVIRRDTSAGGSQFINDITRTGYDSATLNWYVRDFIIGTQGNVSGTSVAHKLFGEYWESLHYSRDLTSAEEEQINRYMNYKWFGSMTY